MKKYIVSVLAFVMASFVMVPSWAQAHSEGFYISSDIGLNIASGIETTGYSNDRASVCDQYINPNYDAVEGSGAVDSATNGKKYSKYNCTGPRGGTGDWKSKFDSATGILAGAAVGYSFAKQNPSSSLGGLRVELEYFYRQSNYDQSKVPAGQGESGDKLQQEIVRATDRIDSMTSHNIFGNLYYDFANTSRFTPYVGIGGGMGVTDMAYSSVWARNADPNRISTGYGLSNAAQIQQNLAGTVSVAENTLSDTLWGLQILFGVDYAVTEAMSLGLKGRYVMFNSFDSGAGPVVWDPLRGHPPYLRTSGTDREYVSGGLKTDNIEFFGISLNMKYHF